MKLLNISTLVALCAISNMNQVLAAATPGPDYEFRELMVRQGLDRPVIFVASTGEGCTSGTAVTSAVDPTVTSSVKGNFRSRQGSIEVVRSAPRCHISLYNELDQGGAVVQRLNTDTSGVCVSVTPPSWSSYGIFCSP